MDDKLMNKTSNSMNISAKGRIDIHSKAAHLQIHNFNASNETNDFGNALKILQDYNTIEVSQNF